MFRLHFSLCDMPTHYQWKKEAILCTKKLEGSENHKLLWDWMALRAGQSACEKHQFMFSCQELSHSLSPPPPMFVVSVFH